MQQPPYPYQQPIQPQPAQKKPGRNGALLALGCGALLLLSAAGGAGAWFFLLRPDTPERAFYEMKDHACAGDVTAFFARIDKTRVAGRMDALTAEEIDSKTGRGAVGALAKAIAKSQMPGMAQAAMTEWEDDIKKGSAGYLCGMNYIRTNSKAADIAIVDWRTRSDKAKTWEFERFGDRWMVVGITDR